MSSRWVKLALLGAALPLATIAVADAVPAAAGGISTAVCPAPSTGVRSSAPGSGKTVALTFDDGPGLSTADILSVLQRYGVPATFFNLGTNVNARPQQVRAEVTLGMALGNHTWSHPHMTTLSATGQGSQMDQANAAQRALVAQPNCLFRPPYGEYNSTTISVANSRRMTVWTWSVDTEDWKAEGSASQYWIDRIISRATAGGSQNHPVILMHNQAVGNPATVAALPSIISFYAARGYTFVDLNGHTGRVMPAPVAVTTAGGLHLFYRADDGSLMQRTRTSGGWSAPTSLGGVLIDGPAAVALDSTTTAVFLQGTDNRLYTQTIDDNGTVSGWSSLDGILMSRPVATVDGSGTVTVAVRGIDGTTYLRARTGGQWGSWYSAGGVLTTGPGAATTRGTELTVAAAGTDTALWVRHRTANWSSWTRVGGLLTAEPALSATVGGTGMVAAVRGIDNNMYVTVGNGSGAAWSPWYRVGGVLTSAPAVTTDGTTLVAFVFGTTGRIYQNVAINGSTATGWSGWYALPG
jgi:peptidoglycan/xylan/chitin deacetylase (PgdA/CDA1 family)